MYKWLHSLAGLQLDFSQTQESLAKIPQFRTDLDQESLINSAVSTKAIVKSIWQRILCTHILQLQLDKFCKGGYLPEIKDVLNKMVGKDYKSLFEPKFTHQSGQIYKLSLEQHGVPGLDIEFNINVNYPKKAP